MRFKRRQKTGRFNMKRHFAAVAILLLTSCGKPNSTAINPAPGGGGVGVDVTLTKPLPAMSEDEMKLGAFKELMRYRSASRYLVTKPAVGATIPAEGCITYQNVSLPTRYLQAQYNCKWSEAAKDVPKQNIRWTMKNTDNFSDVSTDPTTKIITQENASLTLKAHRIPIAKPTAKLKAVSNQTYTRSLTVTSTKTSPVVVTVIGKSANGNDTGTSAQSGDISDGALGIDDASIAPSTDPVASSTSPPAPTPRPIPGHAGPPTSPQAPGAPGSWTAGLQGTWVPDATKPNVLTLVNAELTFTYSEGSSGSSSAQTVFTFLAQGTIAFTDDAKSCPRPVGKFSMTEQKGDAAVSTAVIIDVDGSNITDESTKKTIPWPTDSCIEFQGSST
jgi:hypothetical protein